MVPNTVLAKVAVAFTAAGYYGSLRLVVLVVAAGAGGFS
jgi:hypothetical protein